MLRFRSRGEVVICERCAGVCDQRCRADAIRRRQRDEALLYGWRLA